MTDSRPTSVLKHLTILLMIFLICTDIHAQKETSEEDKGFKFIPMPYLSYSRNLKFEIGALPMVMFPLSKKDTISPDSMAGAVLVYTTNGSFFSFAFSRLFLDRDRWRITLGLGTGNQNSQTYIESLDIPPGFYDYASRFNIIHLGALRKIRGKIYGGLSFTHSAGKTSFEDNIRAPTNNINNGISLIINSDTRGNIYYPNQGHLLNVKWTTFPEWLANDSPANRINISFNRYLGLKKNNDIIALRGTIQAGLGDIDFEQQEVIGQKDIRGYSLGEYRGDGKLALQGEYRKNFKSRLGLVGFFGLATLYGSETESQNWHLYPGVGTGIRYTAFKRNNMNIGLDAAIGDGDWGIYFRIGEAF
ncbi:BamA/TamA family outer membrane protein [Robertkochia flava]|uniref:BamA/TamA family outer membrane protein n=1 Tax=Robertkochia flava TaxID=3447986 RepID=UPI001CCBD9FE|nr:BamA/TamA family outer membrane protein [Robertkochia marina]